MTVHRVADQTRGSMLGAEISEDFLLASGWKLTTQGSSISTIRHGYRLNGECREADYVYKHTNDDIKESAGKDYAWVKGGMFFPFLEYADRFRQQTKLYGSKPKDFQLAIEEAILVESGHGDIGDGSGARSFS